ncbi:MAG TPA: N-6 DNA methylase [Hymenobacter sp.]
MEHDGGQPLSYAQQAKSTRYVALYASYLDPADPARVAYDLHLVRTHDDEKFLAQLRTADPNTEPFTFAEAGNAREMFRAWDQTYGRESTPRGLFEPGVPPFEFGKASYGLADLKRVGPADIAGTYHRFATILRQHNVAGRENAFDKLVNLLLCKIVDEDQNPQALRFRWGGRAFDSDFDLQDRLQQLYRDGMRQMLNEEVTYITNEQIDQAFRYVQHDPDATRDTIRAYFRALKFFTNNAFAFIEVHNEKLFALNAEVLRRLVLLQDMRLRTSEPNQFLGDLFEGFLDAGVKQSEGQFFTPLPVVRFLLYSLPLGPLLAESAGSLPAIDYACGAGHFLNELALELRALLPAHQPQADPALADAGLVGIEKEYRLSKVAKVSAFMYGQLHTRIVHADALARHPDVPADGTFRVLVANPPYSVKGFLQTLPPKEQQRYELFKVLDAKKLGAVNSIEVFFIERAAQLLAPGAWPPWCCPAASSPTAGPCTWPPANCCSKPLKWWPWPNSARAPSAKPAPPPSRSFCAASSRPPRPPTITAAGWPLGSGPGPTAASPCTRTRLCSCSIASTKAGTPPPTAPCWPANPVPSSWPWNCSRTTSGRLRSWPTPKSCALAAPTWPGRPPSRPMSCAAAWWNTCTLRNKTSCTTSCWPPPGLPPALRPARWCSSKAPPTTPSKNAFWATTGAGPRATRAFSTSPPTRPPSPKRLPLPMVRRTPKPLTSSKPTRSKI